MNYASIFMIIFIQLLTYDEIFTTFFCKFENFALFGLNLMTLNLKLQIIVKLVLNQSLEEEK